MQHATLRTIAQIVGCSDSTVSRVLSGKAAQYRISKKKQEEILKIAREQNFAPNPLARSLRTRETLTIGLVIPDISNSFFASIARNVERESRKLGYSIILTDTEEDTDLEIESIYLLKNRNVDGMIISPVGQSVEHIEKLYNEGLAVVIIDRYFPNSRLPYVASDSYSGAKEAVSYLVKNGHNRIACIQGLNYTSPNSDRVRGYKDALEHAHIPLDNELLVGDSFGEENGYLETKILLKKPKPPTAIFAVSNLISLGVIRAIIEENLQIPQDISIVAFDDHPYMEYLSTPMTTVAQPIMEMGRIAMKMLFNQIQNKFSAPIQNIMLPTKLIARGSVRSLVA